MSNLTFNKMKLLSKLRNVDSFQNMSRQQLEDLFGVSSALTLKPGKLAPTTGSCTHPKL